MRLQVIYTMQNDTLLEDFMFVDKTSSVRSAMDVYRQKAYRRNEETSDSMRLLTSDLELSRNDINCIEYKLLEE